GRPGERGAGQAACGAIVRADLRGTDRSGGREGRCGGGVSPGPLDRGRSDCPPRLTPAPAGGKFLSAPLDVFRGRPYVRAARALGRSPWATREPNNQGQLDVPGSRREGLSRGEVALMATRIRPLADRLLVKRLEESEQKSAGGIIIPDTAKEKPQEGKVVAVGRGKINDAGRVIRLDVKAGDRILFGKYSGSEIKIDGEEHLILREEDVLGIVEA